MKSVNCLTLLFIFSFSTLWGQHTILWKITNGTGKNTSYVLGTYHLLGYSFIDSLPVIKEKIKASDLIITETKIDRVKSAEYYNSRPASNALATALPGEDVDYIKQLFSYSKVDLTKYTPGELFVKLQAFYPKYKCPQIKNKDTLSMDEYVQYLAAQYKKRSYYLETDSFQLEKLTAATNPFDWSFFKKNVPALLKKYKEENANENLCGEISKYVSFNIDYKFTTKWSSNLNGILGNSDLVKKRDDDWMTKIPSLLETENCFIAIGLGHLYLDCGIIEQLRQKGYKIEEVKMN